MPSKTRESSPERRREPSKREHSKSEKSERRERHRTSHRRSSTKDGSTKEKSSSRTSLSPSDPKRRSSMPGIIETETDLISSRLAESKTSMPYPEFSRAHSREAVGSLDPARPTLHIFTPPATEFNASKIRAGAPKTAPARNSPPSPPLTDQNAGARRSSTGKQAVAETILEDDRKESGDNRVKNKLKPQSSRSSSHLRCTSEIGPNKSTTKPQSREKPGTPLKALDPNSKLSQRSVSQPTRIESPALGSSATDITANGGSDGTTIGADKPIQQPSLKIFRTPSQEDIRSRSASFRSQTSLQPQPLLEEIVEVEISPASSVPPGTGGPLPPPPPPVVPAKIPRVDYLLQNGGLGHSVPKNLLLAGRPLGMQQATLSPGQPSVRIPSVFEPYHQLLCDFEKVICKNGSLAVATGYRSVARRLLDRLEAVFARDISSESCQCCMCELDNQVFENSSSVSWGEILELVSGRRDLPNWPPFSFVSSPIGLGISLETHVPMQKLDIDVPEEYRDHYIRQSRKTKQAVDKWLSRQTDSPSSPPEEVDDETLTFAILTHLDPEHRPVLKNLLGIVDVPIGPPRRMPTPDRDGTPRPPPTPQIRQRPEAISIASIAIERLYRLCAPPRDPETAIFLLNNPTLHNALATLAAVSNDEWDILISGRFDGFLRSGADDFPEPSSTQGRYTPLKSVSSRGPTPIPINGHARQGSYPSRGPTPAAVPAQYGAPIAFDEETEIATLAEIERDIYAGMEALEDAFEALHIKAEAVRNALRERSGGLAAAAQRRRGLVGGGVEVRMGTPASGIGGDRWDMETDDGLGDWEGVSELAPDDSASNISSSRRKGPKIRRDERRTPALIEEDENEGETDSDGTASPRKR